MRLSTSRTAVVGLVMLAVAVGNSTVVVAQCATCQTPAVAYQHVTAYQGVVAQPVVAYKPPTGWYLGKWFDKRSARRAASKAAYTAAYTAAYAPTYTAAYTAAYAPVSAPTYTAAYRPYVTAYAPLSAPAPAPCSTCAYPVIQAVARPVVMQPVIAASCCDPCTATPSCGCDTCSTGVSSATYSEPACSSCAGGSVSSVAPGNAYQSPSIGQPTPAPTLSPAPASPVPAQEPSRYESNRPAASSEAAPSGAESAPAQNTDPSPVTGSEGDSSTYYNAPRLLDPRDRTARSTSSRQPTVDVRNAVYRRSSSDRPISRTSHRPVIAPAPTRTQADIDADGWSAVSRDR